LAGPASLSARLASLVVGRPGAVLGVAALVGLLALPLCLRLRLDTNVVDLLPEKTPAAAAFARFTEAFGGEQVLVVLVESDDGARLVEAGEQLAAALRGPAFAADVAEVRYRLSSGTAAVLGAHLFDLLDAGELDALAGRTRPEALGAQARRLRGLLAAPGGSALAPVLTADPLEILPGLSSRLSAGLPVDTSSGYFRAADGKALLLFVRPRFSPFEIERDRALVERVGAAAAGLRCGAVFGGPAPACAPAVRVGLTGAYAYALAYRDWLHRDMQVSTVVSVVAVLLLFAVLLGAVRALPAVAPALLLGLWLTAAAAGLIYGRVNAVSLSFGTILISIGIDLPIQIYNRLREELATRPPREAIAFALSRLGAPAVLATLGPTVVFLSCALSRYRGLAELGVLAGVGLLLNLVVMLTVFPAMLALVPARLWMPRGGPKASGRMIAALGRASAARPRAFLLGTLAVCLLVSPLALRLHVDRRLIAIEPPSMSPARVKREVERRFGGREHLLVVLSEAGDEQGALLMSDRWRARAERLRQLGLLSSYESVSSLFPALAEVQERRRHLARLDPPRIAADLRAALAEAGFDTGPFEPFLDRLVHPPAPLTPAEAGPELAFLVSAHVKQLGARHLCATFLYPERGRLDEAVAAIQREAVAGDGELTGEPLLEAALQGVVGRDTVRVTVASVAGVVLLLALYYRRVRPVLAVLLPLGVAWTLFAAALGGLGLPLNLFNLLTVPLVVGYGIDDHVFLVHRFEEAPERGPAAALASTGRAIVVTSLSTMAGFAGLAVARFDGLRLLGAAGALAVALCLLAAFAVLPALLPVLYRRPADADAAPAPPPGPAPSHVDPPPLLRKMPRR